ncbi:MULTISPECIES: pectinesterase family protein [Sorangium]|uniref:pectinesterase family protein n=1 Tax=Sorangium TaxID=39643 RepID=UPI003D9C3F73
MACSSEQATDDPASPAGPAGGSSSAAAAGPSSGTTGSGGTVSPGGSGGAGAGGSAGVPVDCSPIEAAGFELCTSGEDLCGAVFLSGSGCTAVCGAAGLACEAAYENLEGSCGADEALPAVPCDSGHQSDYCVCRGPASGTGGTGGSSGTGGGGGSGAGGSDGGSVTSDCNSATGGALIEVNRDGTGDFTTIQAAINSVARSNTTPTILRIAPGTYSEKLIVDRPHVTLCGQPGQAEATVLTYGDSATTPNGAGGELGTSGSFSVNISASDVSAENITIANSTGPGVQAVALLVSGSRVQFRRCRFLGYQDTLYVKNGTQYFRDCHIEGSVDFIFGGATAVFEGCTIHNVAGGTAITAPSTDEPVPFGIVFLGGRATAVGSVRSGSVALGRNWRPYGSTTYLGTELGAHIAPIGWVRMGDNTLATARFAEHMTTGPGARPSERARESRQLSAAEAASYTVENMLAPWTPTFAD